jgi:hypothetical protein
MSIINHHSIFNVAKVDAGLGLVFGWGIICKENGVDHFDSQGDHICEKVMLEAVSDFMGGDRMAGDMHVHMNKGTIVHSFPLTTEIAKAMGIDTSKTGWMVAMKPNDVTILQKFADGAYTGFSIGGSCSFDVEESA